MLWSKKEWKALHVLATKYELKEEFQRSNNYFFEQPYDFLEILEKKLEKMLHKYSEDYFYEIDEEVAWAVQELTYSELASLSYGIDYNLELRTEKQLISEDNYSVLFYCLVSLPKVKDEGLIRENHGMGYHIHYVVLQNKRQKRTNIVFTFDPFEVSANQHTLYWEHHGSGLNKEPERFGNRRRNAIYDTSCNFLSKIAKHNFRAPVSAANILFQT